MKLLLFMCFLARVYADCGTSIGTNDCCGEDQVQCTGLNACFSNGDENYCRFDGIWVLWFCLMALGVWVVAEVIACIWCKGKKAEESPEAEEPPNAERTARYKYHLNL